MSTDPNAIAFATVPAVTESGPYDMFDDGLRVGCGDTVLESSASLDGFALELALLTGSDIRDVDAPGRDAVSLDESLSVVSTLTYEADPHSPVFLDVGYGVLANDGRVVATVNQSATGASLRFDPLLDGSSWNDVANLGGVQLCDDSPSTAPGDEVALAAGDYEFYAVAQANVTEEMIGNDVLAGYGYGPAPADGAWAPGSIDCTREIGYREQDQAGGVPRPGIPLACEPDAVPGAVIGASAGTITVPYRAGDYTDDVDVTLVSDPIPVHLDQPLIHTYLSVWDGSADAPPITDASEFACDVPIPLLGSRTDISMQARADGGFESLTAAGGAPIQLDESVDLSAAKVSLASPTDAWVIARNPSGSRSVVVGHATASFSQSQGIAIDRYAGYPDVSLELTDLTWCGEPASRVERVIITGEASVTGANGTTSQGTMWTVEFN